MDRAQLDWHARQEPHDATPLLRREIFVPWHPFDHEVLRRAREQQLGDRRIRIHAPEDPIVYKKVFNRAKDIEDIKAMLATQVGLLDLGRIREGASQLLDEAGNARTRGADPPVLPV